MLVFSQANAHKVKHIQNNPNVSLHFNTADAEGEKRLIIFTGMAEFVPTHAPANKLSAYMRKYKGGITTLKMTPEQFATEYSVAIQIALTNLRGSE